MKGTVILVITALAALASAQPAVLFDKQARGRCSRICGPSTMTCEDPGEVCCPFFLLSLSLLIYVFFDFGYVFHTSIPCVCYLCANAV
jgi:hypothetical protein